MNILESSANGSMISGAQHTAKEISQQPELWRDVWFDLMNRQNPVQSFLERTLPQVDAIVLTGAGTSAFIGVSAQNTFRNAFGKATEAISSTHLVTHPDAYFQANKSVLLVSFARSGNSPESIAVVAQADKLCKACYHLIITCNKDGELASILTNHEKFVYVLPEVSNDKSLAMTSSFSGMLLASLLIAKIDRIHHLKKSIEHISTYAAHVISHRSEMLKKLAEKSFSRTVFLGSGPLFGVAQEAQLKMLELTDGIVMGNHDSFLGLRHGPQAVINEKTLVFYLFSNNPYAHKYELDLANSMNANSKPMGQLAVSEHKLQADHIDWEVILSTDQAIRLEEDLLSVVSVVPAQILAFFKSMNLGLSPDNPSRNGAISRVVKGVTIYNMDTRKPS